MIGMQVVAPDLLSTVGVARGRLVEDNVYLCEDLIEKPSAPVAKQRLVSPDLGPDKFLAHGGIYIFSPEIFDCLRELSRGYRPGGEELQLTTAQQMLLKRRPSDYFLARIAGRCMDCGSPAGYAEAFAAIRNAPARPLSCGRVRNPLPLEGGGGPEGLGGGAPNRGPHGQALFS